MKVGTAAAFLFLLAACAEESGPPVSVHAAEIFAPIPGGSAGVAYFTIENRSNEAITVDRIDSPQYENVQMHETIIEDGVSRMRPVATFRVEASSSVEFAPGGKHVMLMRPAGNLSVGSLVTLEIHFDTGLLIVSATMQDRLSAQ